MASASNSQLPEGIATQMTDFTAALAKLKRSLAAFTAMPCAALQGFSPLERAEAFLALAECANVLCHMHLRASGSDPMEHNVKGELERLKQYRKKVNRVTAADELSRARPTVKLDIAAANRFINHAMPSFSDDQAERLRLMTQIYKQKTADEEAQKLAAAGGLGSSMARLGSKKQAPLSTAAAGAAGGATAAPRVSRQAATPSTKKPRRSAAADAADFLSLIAQEAAVEAEEDLAGGGAAEAAAAARAVAGL
ncbi:MAG: hypothetical protein WDW38_008777 [Sanguina aurantia]